MVMLVVIVRMTAVATVMMVVMMTAVATVMVIVVIMTATAAAAVMVIVMLSTVTTLVMVMVMTTTAAFVMLMGMMAMGTGTNGHLMLYGAGDLRQLGDQCIGIGGGEPQLLGGEGDGSAFHLRMGVEFGFDLGGAVGAVQVFDQVYFVRHRGTSYHAEFNI